MNIVTINNYFTFPANVTVNLIVGRAETAENTTDKKLEMKTILAALTLAFAIITGSKERETALKAEIASRDEVIRQKDVVIADLNAALEAENLDDAALTAAVEEANAKQSASDVAKNAAEASLATVNASIAEGETKAQELVTLINSSNEIPANVDPSTGELIPTGQDPAQA